MPKNDVQLLQEMVDFLAYQNTRLVPCRASVNWAVTGVAATNANPDTVLMPANRERKGGTIFNDGSALLYLLLNAGTVTTSNFTVAVPGQGYYEIPFSYGGVVRGVWASATGTGRITEYSGG